MDKLRIAVFGGGYWGKNLIKNFSDSGKGEVKIVCDLNQEVLKETVSQFPFLEATSDFNNVLKDQQIDCVAIATPPSLHYPVAKKALLAKKHTWVEKPLAMQIKEGEELVHLAKKEGLVLFVDETFLYDPALKIVKEMVDSGKWATFIISFFRGSGWDGCVVTPMSGGIQPPMTFPFSATSSPIQ